MPDELAAASFKVRFQHLHFSFLSSDAVRAPTLPHGLKIQKTAMKVSFGIPEFAWMDSLSQNNRKPPVTITDLSAGVSKIGRSDVTS
jgi:hypothetical protein